jgi:uncharacterized membrane protein YhaH (DUF805 family)
LFAGLAGSSQQTLGRDIPPLISNRIGRIEFLFWCGAPIIVGSTVLSIVAFVGGVTDITAPGSPLHGLFGLMVLAAAIVILRAEVSRFHDLGWTGWAALLAFVPIVDIFVFLLLLVVPGQKAQNAYGDPPMFFQRVRTFFKTS